MDPLSVPTHDGHWGDDAKPPAGDSPAQLEPAGRWSLSVEGADFTHASVTVTTGGRQLPVTIYPVVDGYGSATLVWQFNPAYELGNATDRSYDVTVSGIVIDGQESSHSWTTTL